MRQLTRVTHPLSPVYDEHSRILILGSFPSVKSREEGFYYGHPQNRFWKVLSKLLDIELPKTVEEKEKMLTEEHIALWDVIAECEICGSSDSTISSVISNDISSISDTADIKAVFTNGSVAAKLYERYVYPISKVKAVPLPSTSPANAAYSFDRLCKEWSVIKEYL